MNMGKSKIEFFNSYAWSSKTEPTIKVSLRKMLTVFVDTSATAIIF